MSRRPKLLQATIGDALADRARRSHSKRFAVINAATGELGYDGVDRFSGGAIFHVEILYCSGVKHGVLTKEQLILAHEALMADET